MQKIFKELVTESIYNDPRYLVEYCCFRYLSRNSVDVHPDLKELAFRRLIFITMVAWENPYRKGKDNRVKLLETNALQKKLVGEEAFVRIAPAVSGVADCPTAHNLFEALAGVIRVSRLAYGRHILMNFSMHDGRKSYQFQDLSDDSKQKILCLVSSENNW
ncbi:hypothetical protein CASFOL_004592 [Castilleja foliolosa]|uniref:Uncharacterized protein n=1 Tax=Castilleja foliolosa TaxID=1961234 RepID=A0ABD3EAX9_9LAMI